MSNVYRNFVYTFVHEVKILCKTITKHQGVFMAVISLVITNPSDLAVVNSMLTAIVAGCAVLDRYYPNIPA